MRQLIFILIFSVISLGIMGQTDYYAGKEFVRGDNFVFKIENTDDYYRLDDSTNVVSRQPTLLWDGTPADVSKRYAGKPNASVAETYFKAIKEVFTPSEIAQLKGDGFLIRVYINTLSGNIDEVSFFINHDSRLRFISPERFSILERKIKQYATYTIIGIHREVMFIPMSRKIEFDWL